MFSKITIVFVLLPTTFVSNPTCEDDKSFFDSYGWSCKDYDRAPEECKLSKKYERDGKTALSSCCACKNAFKRPNILNGFRLSFLEQIDTRRRQQCSQNCFIESGFCAENCEEVEGTCQSDCGDVQATCYERCEQLAVDSEEEVTGVVSGNGIKQQETSPSEPTLEWYYILIIALVFLGVCCCCVALVWFMRTRVKTAVAGPSQKYPAEEAPMVGNANYAQGVGDYYRPDPRMQYDQQYVGGCSGGPVYS